MKTLNHLLTLSFTLIAFSFALGSLPRCALAQSKPAADDQAVAIIKAAGALLKANHFQESVDRYAQALPFLSAAHDTDSAAAVYTNMGLIESEMLGQPERALTEFEQALPLYHGKDDVHEGLTYANIGLIHAQTGEPDKALASYALALPLLSGLGEENDKGHVLSFIGAVYSQTGEPHQALATYMQALPLLRGDTSGAAETMDGIGSSYLALGQPQQAMKNFNQVLMLLGKHPDQTQESKTVNNIGLVYNNTGQYEKAQLEYERALALLGADGSPMGRGHILNNIGEVYAETGHPQDALNKYDQALPLLHSAHDPAGEATILNNIGAVSNEIGDRRKALATYQQALSLARGANDKAGEGITLFNIGVFYHGFGESVMALEKYNQALLLLHNAGSKAGEGHTLSSIGTIYDDAGDHLTALERYQHALLLLHDAGDKPDEAQTLDSIATVENETGDHLKSLEDYDKALQIEKEEGDTASEAQTLNNIGVVYFDLDKSGDARKNFETALALVGATADLSDAATARYNLARLYERTNQPQQALDQYEKSLAIHESFSSQIGAASQVEVFRKYSPVSIYVRTANILNILGRSGDALAMLERGRTSNLARLAGQSRLPLTTILGGDAPEWQQANDRLNALNRQIQKLRQSRSNALAVQDAVGAEAAGHEIETAEEEQQRAETGLDSLQGRLESDHPLFQRLFTGFKTTYAELSEALLTPSSDQTLFLEYGVYDTDHTLLFTLSRKDGLNCYVLPIGSTGIEAKVAQWRDSITHQSPDEPKWAQELGLALLPETKKNLFAAGRYRSIVIVADGSLLDVPFAALEDSRGKRLIQRYAISSPFSLSMLTWPTSPTTATRNLLAVANPLGPSPSLPDTEQQARQLMTSFQPADLLVGAEADRADALSRMGEYRILHFGVHGEADEENGLFSRLLLAGKTEEDQELTAADVTEHPITAQLTVLSACETMQGQKSGGEGLLGLAWAFRAAGCPSVVASQWKVDEDATASLMNRLYQGLRAGQPKDVALQKAMLGVMQEPGHDAPYFWAAFEVMGTTDPLCLVGMTALMPRAE